MYSVGPAATCGVHSVCVRSVVCVFDVRDVHGGPCSELCTVVCEVCPKFVRSLCVRSVVCVSTHSHASATYAVRSAEGLVVHGAVSVHPRVYLFV